VANEESVNLTLTPFAPDFFRFSVPANVGKLTVSARHHEPGFVAEPVLILLRSGNAPTSEHKDGESSPVNGTDEFVAVVPLPVASDSWYAEVSSNVTAEVVLKAEYPSCGDNLAGANCDITVTELAANPGQLVTQSISTNEVHYYKIKPINGSAIAVNVQSMTAQTNPQVFIRLAVLPDLSGKQYDVAGCTEVPARCKAVAVRSSTGITVDNATYWYIAVVGSADGKYGIWNAENDACPNNCNGNGNCAGSISGGVCECHEDFMGLIDCSEQTPSGNGGGMETWEWVLIVIGIIIAAVILIGLAVYFVRRAQSRAGFERV
jgi:hypothetical protein